MFDDYDVKKIASYGDPEIQRLLADAGIIRNKAKNRRKTLKELPASTPLSDTMSNDLRKRWVKFAGTTICYAFMQATGMVNDHLVACYRYVELKENKSHK